MDLWKRCCEHLETELSTQQYNTWIRPLQHTEDNNGLRLFAPNRFVLDWVRNHYLEMMKSQISVLSGIASPSISLEVGSKPETSNPGQLSGNGHSSSAGSNPNISKAVSAVQITKQQDNLVSNINKTFSFETFVQGKSNQLARAASIQIGENPGNVYNPLFIYGGVGLGKTHLMHAVGNMVINNNPNAKVLYVHSEGFVAEMVKALQHGTMDDFKRKYRSLNALLIDDIQFFAGKERSQEEFFHTFNALFESQQQIIMTSDSFPKELNLEERLKSRFGWGLTVAIEPADLETRVAILKSKSLQLFQIELPDDVAFFIGKRVRSNIRELEGALRSIIAMAQFTGQAITIDFAKDALKDMIAAQDKQVTIENIQKIVAEYFNIRTSDLISAKRSRTVARPRQVAMTLSKELTNHSLPEIGEAFGGRDHTTVLYATRKIAELKDTDNRIDEDYSNLLRILSS